MTHCPPSSCETCPSGRIQKLKQLGLRMDRWDYVIALAGNPNTGKSTIFNALTGLRQHTGNWPGKTITRAEGGFRVDEKRFKLVDLPGTYSLLSATPDEEVARDFILFGRPDVTVVVTDATRLERNLNLVLQVLQITDRVVLCLNLMDEARANGLSIDVRGLSRDLGVPVIPTAARHREGIPELTREILGVASGEITSRPRRFDPRHPVIRQATTRLIELLEEVYPQVPNKNWIAMRLLEGDRRIIEAVRSGELGTLTTDHAAQLAEAG